MKKDEILFEIAELKEEIRLIRSKKFNDLGASYSTHNVDIDNAIAKYKEQIYVLKKQLKKAANRQLHT